jgi:predicted dehydrogenase
LGDAHWIARALTAGKHVVAEESLAMNAADEVDAAALVASAAKKHLVLMAAITDDTKPTL